MKDHEVVALILVHLLKLDRKFTKLMISKIYQSTSPHVLRYRFLQRTIAKEIYKCAAPAFINKAMRSEIHIIKEILSQPDKYNLSTPIAHVVSRETDFITYGDSCLEAVGGFSKDFKF